MIQMLLSDLLFLICFICSWLFTGSHSYTVKFVILLHSQHPCLHHSLFSSVNGCHSETEQGSVFVCVKRAPYKGATPQTAAQTGVHVRLNREERNWPSLGSLWYFYPGGESLFISAQWRLSDSLLPHAGFDQPWNRPDTSLERAWVVIHCCSCSRFNRQHATC